MSARDELRKVIVDHSMRSWSSTRPQDEQVECWCGWTGGDILGHLLDQILARYAVVELPPGDGPDDDGQTYFGDFTIRVDHSGPAEPEIYIGGRKADPHFLELRAAEYLAAVRNAKVVEQ